MRKPLKGFEGCYDITDDGEVISKKRGGEYKLVKMVKGGYEFVNCYKNGEKFEVYIRDAVKETFTDAWKPLKGWEGFYEINDGEIRSVKTGKVLNKFMIRGREAVRLYRNGTEFEGKTVFIDEVEGEEKDMLELNWQGKKRIRDTVHGDVRAITGAFNGVQKTSLYFKNEVIERMGNPEKLEYATIANRLYFRGGENGYTLTRSGCNKKVRLNVLNWDGSYELQKDEYGFFIEK